MSIASSTVYSSTRSISHTHSSPPSEQAEESVLKLGPLLNDSTCKGIAAYTEPSISFSASFYMGTREAFLLDLVNCLLEGCCFIPNHKYTIVAFHIHRNATDLVSHIELLSNCCQQLQLTNTAIPTRSSHMYGARSFLLIVTTTRPPWQFLSCSHVGSMLF